MMSISSKLILKKIGHPALDLYKEYGVNGRWSFIYQDTVVYDRIGKAEIFKSIDLPATRLSDYTLDEWVKIGEEFAKGVEDGHAKYLARRANRLLDPD